MEELDKILQEEMKDARREIKEKRATIQGAVALAEELLPDLKALLTGYEIPYTLRFLVNEIRIVIPWSRDRITVIDTWFAGVSEEGNRKHFTDNAETFGTLRYLISRQINGCHVEFSVILDAHVAGSLCRLEETGETKTFTTEQKIYKIVCPE